jgi:hypothetical protein
VLDRVENRFTGGEREWCRRGVEECHDAGYRGGGRAEGSEVVDPFRTDTASLAFRSHGRAPPATASTSCSRRFFWRRASRPSLGARNADALRWIEPHVQTSQEVSLRHAHLTE